MSVQLTLQGTVKPDGTLELDDMLSIPPGRVLVTVQPVVQPSPDDPFWQLLDRIWADQKARGHVPRAVEQIEADRQALREEMDEEIQEAIYLQEESRRLREQAEQKAEKKR